MRPFLNIISTNFITGETLLSPLVMCGPHGLKFKKPIELRLPHKGNSNDGMTFSLKSSDSPVGEYFRVLSGEYFRVLIS